MEFISEGIAKAVICADVHPIRFENFCNELVSKIEGGAAVVSTSQSWDLGVDGRSVVKHMPFLVCSSLNDHVDRKAKADLKRLGATASRINRVYFCSSQPLSEKRCGEIEAELSEIVPAAESATVLGCAHLAQLAGRHTGV